MVRATARRMDRTWLMFTKAACVRAHRVRREVGAGGCADAAASAGAEGAANEATHAITTAPTHDPFEPTDAEADDTRPRAATP